MQTLARLQILYSIHNSYFLFSKLGGWLHEILIIILFLNLLSGTGSNAALNKADLIKEALGYLLEWIQITLHFYERDKLGESFAVFFFKLNLILALYFQTLSNSLFTAVDASREFAPTEGIIAYYELATVRSFLSFISI